MRENNFRLQDIRGEGTGCWKVVTNVGINAVSTTFHPFCGSICPQLVAILDAGFLTGMS